jgi:hypothetical protein
MKINILLSKYFFQLFIFITLFYLVFQLNYYRHWTSIDDQDLTLLHNSLLLNSGIKSEYQDHPGHTQILIISLWLNFLKLLNIIKVSSYNDLQLYNFTKEEFITLVKYYRFINLLSSIIFAYCFYNIFKIISKNKKLSFLITILLITSYSFVISISQIRTELLSTTFIFLSFLYLIKIINSKYLKRKHVFLSGFFFILSIFGKFQSIFIFLFFPLLISFFKKKKIKIILNNFEYKKIHKIFSLILIFGIFLIWKKYVQGLNYIILPLFIGYFYLLIKYLNNKFFKSKELKFILLFYFLFGATISFVLIFLLKPFHTNNISVIINFFGTSSMFIQGNNPYQFKLTDVAHLFNLAFHQYYYYIKKIFLNDLYNDFLLLFFNTIIILFFLRDKKNLKNYLKIIIFLLIIIFIFSPRPSLNYMIYFIPIIYIYFVFLINKFKHYKITVVFIVLLITSNFYNNANFINRHKLITDEDRICSNEFLNQYAFFYDRMRLELFPKACKKKN